MDNEQYNTDVEDVDFDSKLKSEAAPKNENTESQNNLTKKRTRVNRPYPTMSFEDVLLLAQAIQQNNAGKPVRRLTLFNSLHKSPESSASRDLVTNANKYGVIKGSSSSEWLELTPEGDVASSDEYSEYERVEARVNLAILQIKYFKSMYDEFAGKKFPARHFLLDFAKQIVAEAIADEFIDIFTVNAKFVGLLRVVSGVERLLKLDHLLDDFVTKTSDDADVVDLSETYVLNKSRDILDEPAVNIDITDNVNYDDGSKKLPQLKALKLDDVCFYVSPIGEADSEQRKHSDLFLNYLIQPALEGTGLKVIRADKIDKTGVIGRQIIRHLLKSKLVIADLSFHNPNVFYELAIRHASKLPTVHIIRSVDSIPFDVNQMRTIRVDSTSIYTLIPQLDTYKAEIANQVRRALEGEDEIDNPISIFYPSFKISLD